MHVLKIAPHYVRFINILDILHCGGVCKISPCTKINPHNGGYEKFPTMQDLYVSTKNDSFFEVSYIVGKLIDSPQWRIKSAIIIQKRRS